MKKERQTAWTVLLTAVAAALLLLLWYTVCARGVFNSYVLPSPQKVWKTALKMVTGGELGRDAAISAGRVLKGFGLSFLLALALGSLRALLPRASCAFEGFLRFLKHVPPISMIPLLILWAGIGETTKTVIILLASFFPMYLGIVKGLTGCDPKLTEVGKVFGYSPARIFLDIVVPHAVPDILLGMRTGLGYAWRAIIGAEMVAASTGLGHLILFSQEMSRTDKVIVGILAIGAVGCVTDWLLGLLVRRLAGGKAGNGWD